MKAEIKIKWVQALRSGKYLQGQQELKYGEAGTVMKFCCLGVLCDIEAPGEWAPEGRDRFSHMGRLGKLSANMGEYTGVTIQDQQCLIDMNDRDGASFDQIADYIEENL